MRSLKEGGAEPDVCRLEVCRKIRLGNTKVSKAQYFEATWKNLEKNCCLRSNHAPEKDDHGNQDGEQEQVHLGGPRLTTLALEAGFLLEDQNFHSFKNRTWTVVSLIGSFLSTSIRQHHKCSWTHYQVWEPKISLQRRTPQTA